VIERIGILAHPRRPESFPIARRIAEQSQQRGLSTWLKEEWEKKDVQDLISRSDLVVAIGGDGAMLQAARVCAPLQVPVFGLNVGYLGFLTESNPDDWENCLERIANGDYWIESRLMITGEVWRAGQMLAQEEALNDVVLSRGVAAKTVHLEAYIDGGWATTYSADGLIIATATGSTAYALAVGGPILPPELDNIMMIPVAAHLSLDRPVILSKGAAVTIAVSQLTRTNPIVTVDGQHLVELEIADEVRVKASQNRSLFLRLQDRNYFFRSLMDRMEPRFLTPYPPERHNKSV
jgi:NAD+ kinase